MLVLRASERLTEIRDQVHVTMIVDELHHLRRWAAVHGIAKGYVTRVLVPLEQLVPSHAFHRARPRDEDRSDRIRAPAPDIAAAGDGRPIRNVVRDPQERPAGCFDYQVEGTAGATDRH